MRKRILSLLLALLLTLGLAPPAFAAGDFSDVPAGHWAYGAVQACAASGTVTGFEDGTFRPGDTVTSVQFIVMLTRTFYASRVSAVSTPAGEAWYYPNTKVAADVGMSSGMKAIDDKPINRYEMALVLGNILAANGKTITSATRINTMGKITDYDEIPKNSGYHKPVTVCFALGIITGMEDGSFSGSQTMTRAQACVVITRMMDLLNGSAPSTPSTPTQPTTPAEPTQPQQPETPAQPVSSGKLANGKDATVENVNAMLEELKQQWPEDTIWDATGTDGHYYADGHTAGNDIHGLQNMTGAGLYNTSFMYGCGGFAAMISDKIFGTTGAPAREVTDIKDARPGDILVSYTKDGINSVVNHVNILLTVGEPYANKVQGGVTSNITTADGGGELSKKSGRIIWGLSAGVWNNFGRDNADMYDEYYRCFTRYPD